MKSRSAASARLPDFVEPIKAKVVDSIRTGDWIYKIKFDGYRASGKSSSFKSRWKTYMARVCSEFAFDRSPDSHDRSRMEFSRGGFVKGKELKPDDDEQNHSSSYSFL